MRQFGDSDICRARYRDSFPRTDLPTVSFGGGQSILFCRLPFTAQPLSAVPLRLGFQVQCLSRRTAHNYSLFRDLARDAQIILVLSSSASTLGPDSCSAVFALHRLHIFIREVQPAYRAQYLQIFTPIEINIPRCASLSHNTINQCQIYGLTLLALFAMHRGRPLVPNLRTPSVPQCGRAPLLIPRGTSHNPALRMLTSSNSTNECPLSRPQASNPKQGSSARNAKLPKTTGNRPRIQRPPCPWA